MTGNSANSGPNASSSLSSAPVNMALPGIDTFDAERRRQKALQQLNERLQKTEEIENVVDNFDDDNQNLDNQKNSKVSEENNQNSTEAPSEVVVQ